MKMSIGIFVVGLAILWSATCLAQSAAEPSPTRDQAIAMVQSGARFLKLNGPEALIKAVNAKDPQFVKGELYLRVRGIDGMNLAHPINSKLVGKNMINLPDADGKLFRKEIVSIAKTQGKGWVNYSWPNPESKLIEPKSTYFERAGDLILESGVYGVATK